MIALFDFDSFIYACGFVTQKKDSETGEIVAEPVENGYQAIKSVVDTIAPKFDKLQLYLTGKNNWRIEAATILPYKGNRTQAKPIHYDALRQFCVDHYNAIVVDGMEADDAVGLAQTDDTCILSIDKDLLQIPGNHYHPKRHEHRKISERDGLRNFYKQVVMGDRTDAIPGIEGIGPVNAAKIIDKYSTEKGMWQAAKYTWHENYPEGVGTLSTDEALNEVASLLWISRKGRERWKAPE